MANSDCCHSLAHQSQVDVASSPSRSHRSSGPCLALAADMAVFFRHAAVLSFATALAGCGGGSTLPDAERFGPTPTLPSPDSSMVPTINVVEATGWSQGEGPVAAPGATVAAYSRGLQHPRWLYVLPNGDVLVAETNAPERPEDNTGIKGWFFDRYQKKAGGAVPSANQITLLRDADGNGEAEFRTVFLSGLNAPFGMALVGDALYVANTDAVVRFPYVEGATAITTPGAKVLSLPAGPRNHHWTKKILANPNGSKLYIANGSNSNVAENGMDEEVGRAEVRELDLPSGAHRTYASGLRNPVGMAWEPTTAALWVAVN